MNHIYRVLRIIPKLPALLLIGLVRLYQIFLSPLLVHIFGPLLGHGCRFYPSCSVYFIEAVRKYGAIRGVLRGIWRICRCNPWNPGGFDPP
jgi:putative membrane protein insertion efficiency factor